MLRALSTSNWLSEITCSDISIESTRKLLPRAEILELLMVCLSRLGLFRPLSHLILFLSFEHNLSDYLLWNRLSLIWVARAISDDFT
jgi:hypothetical protein